MEVTHQKIVKDMYDNRYVSAEKTEISTMKSFAEESMKLDEKYANKSVNEIRDLVLDYKIENPKYTTDQYIEDWLPQNDVFNLIQIKDILRESYEPKHVPAAGITTPMIYQGQIGSVFGEHVEDLNFASISILLYGKPKEWYFIPATEGKKLENLHKRYREIWPNPKKCEHPLTHKTAFFNPEFLRKNGITVHRVSYFILMEIDLIDWSFFFLNNDSLILFFYVSLHTRLYSSLGK